MTRHFLRDDDITPSEQQEILDLALEIKANRWAKRPLAGPETVAVIFDKSSTRTRVSFAVGIADLGGQPLIISTANSQLGGKETPSDTARVLERMVAATVPVINALSDDFHPCQLLADLLTILEHKGSLAGLQVVFLGDGGSNMAHSYALAGATAGMHVSIVCPKEFAPATSVITDARAIAEKTGGSLTVTEEPSAALAGADVVVTDTWVSMGKEDEKAERVATFGKYQVDKEKMALAAKDAIFLHCLPADRGFEVAPEVIDGPQSVIWDEAENRVHAQKALMVWLLERV
jgi:ornithine carbamoyltransferase